MLLPAINYAAVTLILKWCIKHTSCTVYFCLSSSSSCYVHTVCFFKVLRDVRTAAVCSLRLIKNEGKGNDDVVAEAFIRA